MAYGTGLKKKHWIEWASDKYSVWSSFVQSFFMSFPVETVNAMKIFIPFKTF